jgi:hypothetical protein
MEKMGEEEEQRSYDTSVSQHNFLDHRSEARQPDQPLWNARDATYPPQYFDWAPPLHARAIPVPQTHYVEPYLPDSELMSQPVHLDQPVSEKQPVEQSVVGGRSHDTATINKTISQDETAGCEAKKERLLVAAFRTDKISTSAPSERQTEARWGLDSRK